MADEDLPMEFAAPINGARLIEGRIGDDNQWHPASPPVLRVPHPDVFKKFLSEEVTTLASTIAYLKWLKKSGKWFAAIRAESLDLYAQVLVEPMGM